MCNMLNKLRKPLSLMLMFVMVFTISGVKPASAEEDTTISVGLTIAAPYAEYTANWVELDKDDLTDDFGLGLPTDGSDGASAIRVLAREMMRFIFPEKTAKGDYNYSKEEREKARAEMPKYLQYKDGFLSGISIDGKTMNAGTAKDGKVDEFGYWGVYINGKYSDVGLGTLDVSKNAFINGKSEKIENIELLWSCPDYTAPTYGDYGYFVDEPYYIMGDKLYNINAKTVDGPQVLKDVYKWDAAGGADGKGGSVIDSSIPVSGAAVAITDDKSGKVIATVTADENGTITLPAELGEGYYTMVATEETTAADGVTTCSRMTRAKGSVVIVGNPKAPQNVKVTSKKAKSITVSCIWPKV